MQPAALEEAIGTRLVVGCADADASEAFIGRLRRLHVQHLIVFARNFTTPEAFVRWLRRLEDGLGRRLLVMVDHEGGRVVRFASGVTRFADALTMGRQGGPPAVGRQGALEAQELRQLGIHVNLAPCVDVIREGSDPVIGDRSYGSDPALVAACGLARIRGLQRQGVAACAKHFPGLGAVPRDPHKTLPTIALDWEAMERTDLPPFRAAVDAGVAMVMSSHVCYPGLGEPAGLPATFSPRLTRELLRDRLGFRGLIVTDDLEMGALRAFGSVAEAAVRATEAGHDLLLICSDLEAAEEALARLRAGYEQGALSQAELEASVERVAQVRKKYLG